jgi:dsDNA-specific endonuclease/ATPase MutS2
MIRLMRKEKVMNQKQTMEDVMEKIKAMTLPELNAIWETCAARHKYLTQAANAMAAYAFKIGDHARFMGRKGRTITIKVDKIKNGKLYGAETSGFMSWKVSASACRLVTPNKID